MLCWLGYWHQRADGRHGNPPQGNQEPLVVRDKVGRLPGELGVSIFVIWDVSLVSFDIVGWATGRASSLWKVLCSFVDGDDLTWALHVLQLQLSPPLPSSLAPIKLVSPSLPGKVAKETERAIHSNANNSCNNLQPLGFFNSKSSGVVVLGYFCPSRE